MQKHNPLFLCCFLSIILAGCGTRPVRVPETDREPAAATAPMINATDRASNVALQALAHMGTPYRLGGASPRTGFDCSGLVAYVYREGAGLALPRNTLDLSRLGEPVEPDALRPGDLVFYDTQRRAYSHVGIYLGENRFIHAPASGSAVRVENLRADYWVRRYSGARRVIPGSG